MKTRGTAILLAILLGGLGAHKFYLGRYTAGFLYFFFSFTFVPLVLSIIDIFVIIIDTKEEFDILYNKK